MFDTECYKVAKVSIILYYNKKTNITKTMEHTLYEAK